MKFERVLYSSIGLVRFVIGGLKNYAKLITYTATMIYSSALILKLASIVVPMAVIQASVIGSTGIIIAGIAVGYYVSEKVLWNRVVRRGFEGIDRGIAQLRDRLCKNLIFCELMEDYGTDINDIMKVLNYGPNVNMKMGESTPLIIAIKREMIPVIEKLIELGADINASDIEGNRPLTIAVEKKGMISIIEKLIELGANINILDRSRRERLIELGVDINALDHSGREREIINTPQNNRIQCVDTKNRHKVINVAKVK